MEKVNRYRENVNKLLTEYLERKFLRNEEDPWIVKKSELAGLGVFSTRDIEVGEIIFKDAPIILGPRVCDSAVEMCVNCYENKPEYLKFCEKKCGLKLCTTKCENAPDHQKECKILREWRRDTIADEEMQNYSKIITKILTPIRSLFLSDEDRKLVLSLKAHRSPQHGFEVDQMKSNLKFDIKEDQENFVRFVCSVLDSNAFEVIVDNDGNKSSVRGLYSLGSLANHNCTPNTAHVFNADHVMVVRASVFIPKNTEIYHSYSRFSWGTAFRRYHLLRTKHFLCNCLRCRDPTEFGTFMGAIFCKICKSQGLVIPFDPTKVSSKWRCLTCQTIVPFKDVLSLTNILGSALNTFGNEDIAIMLRFLQNKLSILVPETHAIAVELKLKIVWIIGYQENFTWPELDDDLLQIKEKFCKDLLLLLEGLQLGQCIMRGLLLYELYSCIKEKIRREKISDGFNAKIYHNDMRGYLAEAADILKFDVGAPKAIKMLWAANA